MNASVKKRPAENAVAEECPRCGGYGYVIAKNVASPCDCGIIERNGSASRFDVAAIPARYANKTFDTFRVPKGDRQRAQLLESADSYATSFSKGESSGLMLRGAPGSGKTHIAISILREVIARGFTGKYWNFNDLLTRLRDTYREQSPLSEEELLHPADSMDLLILDDVGAENASEWVRDRLYLIINRRYESAKATIITTNLDEADMESRVGARIASRLCEMCDVQFPAFPAQDWRKANMR